MLSRRILRIKALQVLYAFFQSSENSFLKAEKDLVHSLNKTYDLFHYLLLIPLELRHFAQKKIEAGLEKHLPSAEDLHPNRKFVRNRVIDHLDTLPQLTSYLNEKKLSWVNHPDLIRALFQQMTQSTYYQNYMTNAGESWDEDLLFLCDLYTYVISESEELSASLEEQSIFWNDELEFVLSIIVATLRKFKESNPQKSKLPPMIKEEDDLDFVKTLVRKTIQDQKESMVLIEKYARNWEIDRIAFMDILIMMMALSEAIHFPEIPTKVTMNEYLEIAKFYSTDKSSNFINGILDHAFSDLKTEKRIVKTGHGLIGEF